MQASDLKLRHRTMSSAILEQIRQRVLDGSYPAGQQLRQDSLADEFGVSRIPVREALFQLEAEGFVKISPHRGATVTTLSAADVAEAFELRELLEPRLLASSAPGLTKSDYDEIEAILTDYSAAMANGDTPRWGELNTTLHLTLYRRTDRPRILSVVTGLLVECDRYTRLQLSAHQEGLERADREHRELVRLCKAGEVEEAVSLLRSHIAHVAESLRGYLDANSPQLAGQ